MQFRNSAGERATDAGRPYMGMQGTQEQQGAIGGPGQASQSGYSHPQQQQQQPSSYQPYSMPGLGTSTALQHLANSPYASYAMPTTPYAQLPPPPPASSRPSTSSATPAQQLRYNVPHPDPFNLLPLPSHQYAPIGLSYVPYPPPAPIIVGLAFGILVVVVITRELFVVGRLTKVFTVRLGVFRSFAFRPGPRSSSARPAPRRADLLLQLGLRSALRRRRFRLGLRRRQCRELARHRRRDDLGPLAASSPDPFFEHARVLALDATLLGHAVLVTDYVLDIVEGRSRHERRVVPDAGVAGYVRLGLRDNGEVALRASVALEIPVLFTHTQRVQVGSAASLKRR